MEKQSKHFVDDDVRKKNKQNTNIFLFFFFFYSVGCFSVCGKKKINKLKKEEKKKLPLSSSFKNTQNQRVLGSNWHANTPSQNKKEKKINKKKKKKMREKSIRCLSTPSVDAAILSEMALQTMREKRRRRRRWWNTIKNKNNKSIQQQATTTVCGASRPTGICASVCSEVRAVLLLLWWIFFFFYFSFLLLFSILSGVHAGTFYMTSRWRIWKKKADKIQLSRESFDRSRLEVKSNSKSCETVNWTNPRM